MKQTRLRLVGRSKTGEYWCRWSAQPSAQGSLPQTWSLNRVVGRIVYAGSLREEAIDLVPIERANPEWLADE